MTTTVIAFSVRSYKIKVIEHSPKAYNGE